MDLEAVGRMGKKSVATLNLTTRVEKGSAWKNVPDAWGNEGDGGSKSDGPQQKPPPQLMLPLFLLCPPPLARP